MECYMDFVICIDATESMAQIINEVKQNAITFYMKCLDDMKMGNGYDVGQFRIKIIAFRDYGVDDEPMKESDFFVIPDQYLELQSFLDGIHAKGGMESITGKNEPSNALEAISLALKSDWTTRGPEDAI